MYTSGAVCTGGAARIARAMRSRPLPKPTPGVGGAADLLHEAIVAAAAADAALGAETVGVELERRARVVVEAAHEPEVQTRLQAGGAHKLEHRVEVLAAVRAQVVDDARRLVQHGAARLDLAVERAQRIERDALAAVAAELVPRDPAGSRAASPRTPGGRRRRPCCSC